MSEALVSPGFAVRPGRALLLGAAVATAIAVWLRLASVLDDFPSGDGGLFWVMADDLRANGFLPPDRTTYNTGDIPWVYPPIGIYLVALLGNSLDLFRILPALWAIATLPALWLLARELVGERAALAALIAYGLTAPAYIGLIAGGGVTRGPGVLFAILTMWAVVRGNAAGAGVLAGLTILTHPIAAVYAALGSGALWAMRGARPRMLLAVPIALAIGAAWFGPMILHHGIDPLLAGVGSRDIDIVDNAILLLAETINPPNMAFTIGAAGLVMAAVRHRWDLLVWFVVTAFGAAVVDRWVAIPLAVLAGLAVDAALVHPRRLSSVALLAVAAVTTVSGVVLADPAETLTAEQRDILAWAESETPPDASFAVIGYPVDRGFVEWFPALSGRVNVTTWQGSEWVPGAADQRETASTAGACDRVMCLPGADFYVLRPGCCPALVDELVPVRDGIYKANRR